MNFPIAHRNKKLLALLFCFSLLTPVSALAQYGDLPPEYYQEQLDDLPKNDLNQTGEVSIPAQIRELKEQLSIDISPETPAPNDQVTITIDAFGTDLNRAQFTWLVNGVRRLTGVGERVFVYTMGNIGTQNDIRVEIVPVSGPTIVRNFSFTPGDVDVIWEARTYTPPFYRGKALFTPEADVIAVAVPNLISNNTRLNPKNAVYNWRFNYRADAAKSGYAKNVYSFTGSIIKKVNAFEVESYDPRNTSVRGRGFVEISEQSPDINLYYNHPLLGILFNQTLSGIALNDDFPEISVVAFPFYQSISNRNQSLYRWSLGGETISLFNNQSTISLRKTDIPATNDSLVVQTSLNNKILQFAENRVYLSTEPRK